MASFFEGEELVVGDDEMVQDLDSQNLAGLVQAAGELDVVLARRGVA